MIFYAVTLIFAFEMGILSQVIVCKNPFGHIISTYRIFLL